MSIVLVHGNPETDAIRGPLVDALGCDVLHLSPPGFGAPLLEDLGHWWMVQDPRARRGGAGRVLGFAGLMQRIWW